jgi:hypothetical protein
MKSMKSPDPSIYARCKALAEDIEFCQIAFAKTNGKDVLLRMDADQQALKSLVEQLPPRQQPDFEQALAIRTGIPPRTEVPATAPEPPLAAHATALMTIQNERFIQPDVLPGSPEYQNESSWLERWGYRLRDPHNEKQPQRRKNEYAPWNPLE